MKVKYFLRGLGIGILVTTLLLFVGARKNVQSSMTDEQIMKRAKQLGMLTKDEVSDYKMDQSLDNLKETINESTSPKPSKKPEVSEKTEPTEPKTETSASPVKKPEKKKDKKENDKKENDKKENEAETISIKIEPGMVSQSIARYLYQKNVVGSASDFNKYMQELDVTGKLRAGEFEIPKDATYEEIVEIIT